MLRSFDLRNVLVLHSSHLIAQYQNLDLPYHWKRPYCCSIAPFNQMKELPRIHQLIESKHQLVVYLLHQLLHMYFSIFFPPLSY